MGRLDQMTCQNANSGLSAEATREPLLVKSETGDVSADRSVDSGDGRNSGELSIGRVSLRVRIFLIGELYLVG
jgi:hypothetical protein